MSYSPKNPNGQETMANSEPVVIASDQSAVPVSAASLPLPSGAATSAKQDTGNTSLATIAGAVAGTEMQVDVLTIAAGDNNIGNVDIASALPAGTNNIGDVDVLTIPRSQSGPGQPGTAVDSYTQAAINLSAGANQVLVASAANKQIWVYGISFTLNVAGTVSFQDEDDTAVSGVMPFAASSGLAIPPSGNFSMPLWKLPTDKDLEVDLVTADMDGFITYAIVSV